MWLVGDLIDHTYQLVNSRGIVLTLAQEAGRTSLGRTGSGNDWWISGVCCHSICSIPALILLLFHLYLTR